MNDWMSNLFEGIECPICGRGSCINSWGDYCCSPEHRREYYINTYDWKEPENPVGWYIAEFKGPWDTKNISPEEIYEHNKKITDAPETIRTSKERLKEIEKSLKEIDTEIYVLERDNEGFISVYYSDYDDEVCSYSPEELRARADEIELAQSTGEYKRYETLKDKMDQLNFEKKTVEKTLETASWYLKDIPLKPNR